jgi:glycosyltransferase involved in cell wall biosynthesis
MRLCAIIPTYDNPRTIGEVVERVRAHVADVVVVDDGSTEANRAVVQALADGGKCQVVMRPRNRGKGAAVKTGLAWAHEHGFTYALQIDADLQHDASDIPELVGAIDPARDTLVLGQPTFDASAPALRRRARKISVFWVAVETLSRKIGDPLCGFRVYPVAAALRVRARGDAMDFDAEIAVRLAWAGVHVVHVPTAVIYLSGADGGVSHYRGFTDTMLISLAHSRLCIEGLLRLVTWPVRALYRRVRPDRTLTSG